MLYFVKANDIEVSTDSRFISISPADSWLAATSLHHKKSHPEGWLIMIIQMGLITYGLSVFLPSWMMMPRVSLVAGRPVMV